jgi:hypothetical protein
VPARQAKPTAEPNKRRKTVMIIHSPLMVFIDELSGNVASKFDVRNSFIYADPSYALYCRKRSDRLMMK